MASSPPIITQTYSRRHQTRSFEERPVSCPSSLRVLRRQSLPRRRPGALRNTSVAKAASRQAPLAFRSLDPFRALREPDCRRRDEKRPFPLRTKNCQHNPKQPLDRKSPIQVRIRFPPAVSLMRTAAIGSAPGQNLNRQPWPRPGLTYAPYRLVPKIKHFVAILSMFHPAESHRVTASLVGNPVGTGEAVAWEGRNNRR